MPVEVLKADIALDLLRGCLNHGDVIYGRHFRKKVKWLKKRPGVTLTDVWQVLRSGAIEQPPELHEDSGSWRYAVEGYTPD